MALSKVSPFLWFNKEAEDAARFYVSLFPRSELGSVVRYPKGGPMPEGTAMTVSFSLDGVPFTALNAGPGHPFTDAISFVVSCADQPEIDMYWSKLTADGGEEGPCGWCKDKFGLSWQIVPENVSALVGNQRGMAAMMKMKKLDIAALKAAQ